MSRRRHRQPNYEPPSRLAGPNLLTFSPKWVKPILEGKKGATFRKWPVARVKVGGVYAAATAGSPPKKFATVEVTA